MSALKYWIWLSTLEKVGLKKKLAALRWFGEPETVYKADKRSLKMVEELSADDIIQLQKKDMTGAEEILEQCNEKHISVITFQDAAYPPMLRYIDDPPLVLYTLGNLIDFAAELPIAVVGTRKCSAYGALSAKTMGYQIANCGGLVVSGMAEGIDAMAQQGALLAGKPTVAVLGGGVDIIYPKSNRNLYKDLLAKGMIISEYPPGTAHSKTHFPVRNRIISGMSYGVVVVECPKRSGSLITARRALDQGRDVFAVPGNIDNYVSAGSNQLIKDGAPLVTKGWDVISEYAHLRPDRAVYKKDSLDIRIDSVRPIREPEKAEESNKNIETTELQVPVIDKKEIDKEENRAYIQRMEGLDPDAQAVVAAIGDKTRHVDDIIDITQLKAARVLATLTLLEINGIVRQSSGKRYSLAVNEKR
ncbi:MAG: DNA-protecting protein DprA [Ruminococcaceae bacterium]|nr:DNA-protecting protein DprA [Oscillospiraceae bacterium]